MNTFRPGFRFRLAFCPVLPIVLIISRGECRYTHFCRIRDEGGAGRPPLIIFEGRNLPQQTIYHWKGNLSKSPIHFRYQQNILILRLYEQFSRNDSAMAPEKISNYSEYEHIIYHFEAHDLEIPLTDKLFREIFKFRGDMSKNGFREIS